MPVGSVCVFANVAKFPHHVFVSVILTSKMLNEKKILVQNHLSVLVEFECARIFHAKPVECTKKSHASLKGTLEVVYLAKKETSPFSPPGSGVTRLLL